MSDSLWLHELQHARPPCSSPTPRVHPDSRPLSQWCHPAISSSVVPFSSCPQSLPASESFPMSQLFTWVGQSTGVSDLASFLPKNTQDWSPLEWTGWIYISLSYALVKTQLTIFSSLFMNGWLCSIDLFVYYLCYLAYCAFKVSLKSSAPTLRCVREFTCW